MLHSVEYLSTPAHEVGPERARFSAAVARIQRRLAAAGLDREVTLIVSPGEFSLRAPIEGADRASLRITIPPSRLLTTDPDALADGFAEAYRALIRWELENPATAPPEVVTNPTVAGIASALVPGPRAFAPARVLQRA